MWIRRAAERWFLVGFGLVVLAALGPLIVDPVAEQTRIPYVPDRERDRSSGVVLIVRGLQLSLADICYNKSTDYQHSGAKYRDLKEDILGDQLRDQQDTTGDAEPPTTASVPTDRVRDEGQYDEPDVLPLILKPHEDFRGVIGRVEREVKPYAERHLHHVKPIESLPWLRLATWINPDHEMAWVAAAFWLQGTKRPHAVAEAINLLEQARRLSKPPKDGPYEKHGLLYMLGHLYLLEARDPATARAVFEEAVQHGVKDFPRLDPIQQDWLNFSFRDLVQACRKLKRYDQAIAHCKRGIELFPEDGVLQRTLLRLERERQKRGEKTPEG